MLGVFTFVVSLFVSTALIPPLTRVSVRWGLIDLPDERKVHLGAIPRIGGLAIIIGVVTPVLMWVPLREDIRAYLIGILILTLFGVWDDRKNLDFRLKLIGQVLAVLILVFYGGVMFDRFPFMGGEPAPSYIAVPFTIVLLVGITNAVNLSDGLDGLAGGIALLAVACLALLAYGAKDQPIVLTCLAVIGATLGFLRYNTYPARIFMGDTGSQFLGFTAGFLAIVVTHTSNPALSSMVPVFILGLPVLDTLLVMSQRIAEGRSPFSPDRNHVHHKLLAMGFSHYEAVMGIYAAQALLVSSAFMLKYSWDGLILILYLLFCLLVTVLFKVASIRHWNLREGQKSEGWVGKAVDYLRETGLLSKVPYLLLQVAVPVFFLSGALLARHVTVDFSVSSAALLLVFFAAFLIKAIPFGLVERLVTYVTASFITYLLETTFVATTTTCVSCYHGFFALLALLIALWVRFTQNRVFQINALDFLIVFIAVVVPNIPGFLQPGNVIGAVAIESILLFYAAEVLLSQKVRGWEMLRFSTIGALAVLSIRAFL